MTSAIYGRKANIWQPAGVSSGHPPPPVQSTIFGSNVGDGNPNSAPATRLSQFGRIPAARVYYSGALPSTFESKITANAPEKRIQISFKGWQPSQIIAGAGDANITAFCALVPSDWLVYLTYWHEPNSELRDGVYTPANFINAQIYISELLWSLGSRNIVVPMPCYSAPNTWNGNAWNDSWLVHYPAMNNPNAIMSWDVYANPHGVGGLTGLDIPYATNSSLFDPMYQKTVLGGWNIDLHWGLTEFNAPRRNFDATELQRSDWFNSAVTYILNKPTTPYHIFLWEGNGVQWDQNFYTTLMRDTWKNITAGSA